MKRIVLSAIIVSLLFIPAMPVTKKAPVNVLVYPFESGKGEKYMRKCIEIDRKNSFLKLNYDMKDYEEMVKAYGR